MGNKLNIAELLKHCPKGMELDCTMYDGVTLDKVSNNNDYPIRILTKNGFPTTLTKYGQNVTIEDAKCVIFPKGKTTWEGFVPPCKFKDGDIVFSGVGLISIFKGIKVNSLHSYVSVGQDFCINIDKDCWTLKNIRFATEEEKGKLFQAIKDNGYKWNPKTKTLEKLITPKFKVGDRIRKKGEISTYTITDVNNAHYFCGKYVICGTCDNDWELVPNKFDISTLKPFESRVLVRDLNKDKWKSNFWGFYDNDNAMNYPYECCGNSYAQCIPYEGNEHLLGKSDECNDFYKTWKE